MTDIRKLMEDARKTRDEKKIDYEKAEYFYETLVKKLGVKAKEPVVDAPVLVLDSQEAPKKFAEQEQVDISSLGVVAPSGDSFASYVERVVKKFGAQEFMVVHVEKLLEDMGKMPTGKSPRAKIAGNLTKLEKRGVVVKTHKGSGNEPNRYKLAEFSEDEDQAQKEKPKTTNVLGLSANK